MLCGMCCNGALFQSVALQPCDSQEEIAAAGLRIERQKDVTFFRQPCSALQSGRCTIYELRPSKCREFVCKLLAALEDGEIDEVEAEEVVREAVDLRLRLIELLERAGDHDETLPLSTRYQRALERPVDIASMKTRSQLMVAATSFAELLEERFRIDAP